jgi:hypothetical protein
VKILILGVLVLEETAPPRPLTVERIVRKLAELSEGGTKAVCLTYEQDSAGRESQNFAHDHSNEIERMARAKYPFFGRTGNGCFSSGSRGYFWTPESIVGARGNLWPNWEKCINFPISAV